MFFRKLFKKTKHTTYETKYVGTPKGVPWEELEPDERAVSTVYSDYPSGYLQVRISKGDKSIIFHTDMKDLAILHLVFNSMLSILRYGTDEDIRYAQEQDMALFKMSSGKK